MVSVLTTHIQKQRYAWKFLEVMYMLITLILVMISWDYAYVQLIKLYALNMCRFFNIYYTSLKL